MDTFKPEYAIKLSSKNFGYEGNKKIVPLYARVLYLDLVKTGLKGGHRQWEYI